MSDDENLEQLVQVAGTEEQKRSSASSVGDALDVGADVLDGAVGVGDTLLDGAADMGSAAVDGLLHAGSAVVDHAADVVGTVIGGILDL